LEVQAVGEEVHAIIILFGKSALGIKERKEGLNSDDKGVFGQKGQVQLVRHG
jgi:hypothetical protein